MISIIICSRLKNPELAFLENIEATIGVPYEIISIDNSANKYGICEAYNLGVSRSIYDYVCFMHDDIVYHSGNWGKAVLDHFKEDSVTAIGIAGTPYCTFMPGPWWGTGEIYEHILQSSQTNDQPALKTNIKDKRVQVVTFDGVWFCIKKAVFDVIRFDDVNFKGFHLYDMDICMQLYNQGLKIYCVSDILIHHLSMGSVNSAWIENELIFHDKWRNTLPASCISVSNSQSGRYEYKTLNAFIWICFANGWSNKKIFSYALQCLFAFKKGYFFYKTPGYFLKFLFKRFFKQGEPFYAN